MFMQAGFALVETGFTRAKNAAHTMTMNFMVYGSRCWPTGRWASPCRRAAWGRSARWAATIKLSHEVSVTIGGKTWGLFGRNWLLPHRRRLHRAGFRVLPVPDGVHGHGGHDPHRSAGPSGGNFFAAFAVFSVFVGAIIIRSTPTGLGAAAGSPPSARTSAGATATSTSRIVRGAHDGRRNGVRHRDAAGPAAGKYNAVWTVNAIPGHNIRWRWSARSSSPSGGSGSRRIDAGGL